MPLRGCRHPRSAALALMHALDDDDILREILVRLPPSPSSLPRASLVCPRWRRLVSDPDFLRRFRARHRTPPLLGFYSGVTFVPTQDPPDRVPAARFSLDPHGDEQAARAKWRYLTCCHGLVLGWGSREFQVFDPMSGPRHRVPSPVKGRSRNLLCIFAAVVPLPDSVDRRSFRIVALFSGSCRGGFASVYSSESGVWEDSVAVLPSNCETSPAMIILRPSTLVGAAIYWMLSDRQGILEFDLDRQSLAIIKLPPDAPGLTFMCQIMPTEGGQLGLAALAEHCIQFWERETDLGNPAGWVQCKTVRSDSFLPLGCSPLSIVGFDEQSKVIFLRTDCGVFMVNLDTMQSKKVLEEVEVHHIIPYSSF
ncbi:hypothetical protein ACP70R_023334 [Stipagrostis hirtigluma subsp. patula]